MLTSIPLLCMKLTKIVTKDFGVFFLPQEKLVDAEKDLMELV